jgi:hypothetical protein
MLPPIFQDAASDGLYLILQNRTPVVLIGGATTATPAAAIIPLDNNFAARADAALRLWQAIAKRSVDRSSDSLTPARRRRLTLVLRALDAYLAGETYRVIAQGLFGERRVPSDASWKTHDLRDRTIRLVSRSARSMGGALLASPIASLRRDRSATHAFRPIPAGSHMTCATAPFASCA